MKRKNLFLSLICSIVLAVALTVFTVVSVIPQKDNGAGTNNVVTPVSDNGAGNVSDDSNNNNNASPAINETRDGSEENPYVIYDAETFVTLLSTYGAELKNVKETVKETVKVPVMVETVDEEGNTVKIEAVDEEGNTVYTDKVDEKGNVVYVDKVDEEGKTVYVDKVDEEGNVVKEPYHFEIANDIDFTGVDYTTLFNNGKEFIGVINGNGKTLKNISINVTKSNFVEKYAFVDEDGRLNSYIGVFGNLNGAVIENLTVKNLSVSVDSALFSYIKNGEYNKESGAVKEFIVGSIAGVATDTTFTKVNINSNINGFSYSLYRGFETIANNAVGGLVAVATNITVSESNITSKINVNAGEKFHIGGVAAYGYGANIEKTVVNVTVDSAYDQVLYIGGVFSYARAIEITDSTVNLAANENTHSEDERASFVAGINSTGKSADDKYTWISGIVNILRANDETQKATMTNVKVNSNVDLDAIFAGVVMNVWNAADQNGENIKGIRLVNLKDVVVDANVNVLKAYGYSRDLVVTNVTFSEEKLAEDGYYNIKLVGTIKLVPTSDMIVCSLFTLNLSASDRTVEFADLHIVFSSSVYTKLRALELQNVSNTQRGLTVAAFGSVKIVD